MAAIPVTIEPTRRANAEGPAPERVESDNDTEELREQLLRTAAELDNVRKRTQRRVEEARQREREAVVREFLDVVDTMDLALSSADRGDANAWIEGMRAVRRQTLDTLERLGVEPFSPEGEPFDPTLHEAVECRAAERGLGSTVAEVFRPGYRTRDGAILRTARVAVA